MTAMLLRGRLLSFKREPLAIDDGGSYSYIEDGALLIEDGIIKAVGDYGDVSGQAPADCTSVDHRPHLIMPGFIDTHLHFPQMTKNVK